MRIWPYELINIVNIFLLLFGLYCFRSSPVQHDVHFVNCSPILSKRDDTAGLAWGRCCLVVNKLLPQHVFLFSVSSNQDLLPISNLFTKYGHFWFQNTRMVTAIMSNSRQQNDASFASAVTVSLLACWHYHLSQSTPVPKYRAAVGP